MVELTVANQLLNPVDQLKSIGIWFATFKQLEDREVLDFLATGKPRSEKMKSLLTFGLEIVSTLLRKVGMNSFV